MIKRIYLEITNACNLQCLFCTNPKGNTFISSEDFEHYTDQIAPICKYLYLHILGEPLLHPQIDEFFDILDQKDFMVQLVTNGTLLDMHPDIIKHKSLRKLSISLHSINQSEVSPEYFDTIDKIINNHQCILELRFYDPSHMSNQLKGYYDKLICKYGLKETKRKGSYLLKENVFLSFDEFFKWPNKSDPIISDRGKCLGGIEMLAINSSGEVTLCCLDPYAENKLGNLKKEDLITILSSEKYKEIIKGFREQKVISPFCQSCSYRLRFDENNNSKR